MRVTSFVACGFVVVLAGTAHAQTTKFSGKCVAQKADPAYTAEVGDLKSLRTLLTALRNLEAVFDAYRVTPS